MRKEYLLALAEEVQRREDNLLTALKEDLGKPGLEAWLAEFHFLVEDLKLMAKKVKTWSRPQRVLTAVHSFPARSWFRREAFGTVLIFSPWNYPVQLALSPLAAALAAGNTVVLKPSELAPASSRWIEEVVRAVLPETLVQVVQGDGEIAEALLEQPFDFFFYTGSERHGRAVAQAAAKHLSPCALELGGKCPVIIGPGADLEKTVERIVSAKLFNRGQTCFAPDFLLVPEGETERWVEAVRERVRSEIEAAEAGELARMVNHDHYERVLSLAAGEEKVGEDDQETLALAPRIFTADWQHPAMQEEIFGPVLPVIAYGPELKERFRSFPSPLALYLFSDDSDWLAQMTGLLRSGGVCYNDLGKQAMNHRLPFGGVGRSGYGRYRGKAGFQTFTYERSYVRRWFLKDPMLLKRPYGKTFSMLRRFL